MILAQNQETAYKIIIAQDASVQEQHAVSELRSFLRQITGANFQLMLEHEIPLEIQPNTPRPGVRQVPLTRDTRIVVGDTAFGARMGYTPPRDLGKEGFSIHTDGDRLYIIGGRPRGVLYGVYTFLETWCGCRWFTDTVSRIPRRQTLEIPEIDDTQVPVLEYREPQFSSYAQADWYVRNKCNSSSSLLSGVYGGQMCFRKQLVHTFNEILDPAEHFSRHPEYFSEIDGVRACPEGRTQLCLTNPEVLQIAKAKVHEWLLENPELTSVSISPNDWDNYCTCEKCRAIDEREESHMGSLLAFVNAIADDIKEDYPDVCIDTLAYTYTRKVPKFVRPRDNVIIRLCASGCCFMHPLETCRTVRYKSDMSGSTFADDLRAWSQICRRIYIWDYVVSFWHNLLPYPNWPVLQPNLQFFVQNHATGVFEQGNSFRGKYGQFDEMKQYVLAKLLWNPWCDMNVHVNEFIGGVYGTAAGEVRQYYDLLWKLNTPDLHIFTVTQPDHPYLTDEFLAEADACLARAELAADSDEVLERVRVLRLSTRYALLWRIPMDDPNRDSVLDAFYQDVVAAGIDTFYWRQLPDKAVESIRAGDMRFGTDQFHYTGGVEL